MKTAAALYLRVSTEDQTTENQRPDLERIAKARELKIVEVYDEKISATAKKRPAFDRMMKDAHAGKFRVVVVWALDRLGRSMIGILNTIRELDARGVEIVSTREAWLSMHGPVRELLIAVFGWVAQVERHRLIERTVAGQARARAEGTRIGRPRRMVRRELERAHELAAKGASVRLIAQTLRIPRATVARALKRVSQKPPPNGTSKTPAKSIRTSPLSETARF